MENIDIIIQKVQATKHGFKNIQNEAEEIAKSCKTEEALRIAKQLFMSEIHQVRSLATFILGYIAKDSSESMNILKSYVSHDKDWRVQEILAKAFDNYCADIGYKKALPVIKVWLNDPSPNVRRAVTEGLRIWTSRPFFRENPDIAIQLLTQFRNDESEYLRKSVGNALRDISKKHKKLISNELKQWDISNKYIRQTYKLASKFLSI